MRAMQTAGTGRTAPGRGDSGRTAWAGPGGLGAGAGLDRGMSAVLGDARKHRMGGMVFRMEEPWQGRAGGARGKRGRRNVDAGERVARGEEWQPTGPLKR